MSFIEGFFSFGVELNNSDTGYYQKVRFKTARHPSEGQRHFYARILSYLHAYTPGLEFSEGLYAPNQPTIWKRDIDDSILEWIEVGCPDEHKIKSSLKHTQRHSLPVKHSIYFYDENQRSQFCHHLKGSKTNWVEHVRFFSIREPILENLAELERSSSVWKVVIVDGVYYMNCNQVDLEAYLDPVDIWKEYQLLLEGNVSS